MRLSARGLRRDPQGSVKQIHHEELKGGDKERPSAFPKIMLKQTDSGIQQLRGAGERTQDQRRRRRLPRTVELTAAQLRHGVQLFFWSVRLESTR
jgi:hypothetical protein